MCLGQMVGPFFRGKVINIAHHHRRLLSPFFSWSDRIFNRAFVPFSLTSLSPWGTLGNSWHSRQTTGRKQAAAERCNPKTTKNNPASAAQRVSIEQGRLGIVLLYKSDRTTSGPSEKWSNDDDDNDDDDGGLLFLCPWLALPAVLATAAWLEGRIGILIFILWHP